MKLPILQVDAFTSHVFSGNPAAVVPLHEWLPDDVLQQIAMENNLSETAFFVPEDDGYHIRWFTPSVEVNLCGHATLATSHVLYNHLDYSGKMIRFHSRSGDLSVRREGDYYLLDFPSDKPETVEKDEFLLKAFDRNPVEVLKGKADFLVVFDDEHYVREVVPDMDMIKKLDAEGVIITSRSEGEFDFVSRFFAPRLGIPEDPVTGSAHTVLIPYWSDRIGKDTLAARQVSNRGGVLKCRYPGDRVEIGGRACTYLEGIIYL
ncbi:MAG: hypothetical protein PWQ06_1924 [Anaerophaga sp.]|jgi:PhzF family phenazine biosynthesis protein|nr:hypothetical protein [Anaerophaga sp.]